MKKRYTTPYTCCLHIKANPLLLADSIHQSDRRRTDEVLGRRSHHWEDDDLDDEE